MDDLISRQAAIEAFWKLDVEIRPSAINAIIDMIRTLPPAETPKRTGKSAQNVPNDDLISRKAAIEAVDATWWNARGIRKTIQELPSAQPELIEKTAYIRGFEQGRTQGMFDTKAEEVAQSEQRWILCSERLPDEEDIYLVMLDQSNLLDNETQVTDAYWTDGQWQYGVLESYEHSMPKLVIEPIEELKVIAWMPLPEPYKGEETC